MLAPRSSGCAADAPPLPPACPAQTINRMTEEEKAVLRRRLDTADK